MGSSDSRLQGGTIIPRFSLTVNNVTVNHSVMGNVIMFAKLAPNSQREIASCIRLATPRRWIILSLSVKIYLVLEIR